MASAGLGRMGWNATAVYYQQKTTCSESEAGSSSVGSTTDFKRRGFSLLGKLRGHPRAGAPCELKDPHKNEPGGHQPLDGVMVGSALHMAISTSMCFIRRRLQCNNVSRTS